MKFFDWVQPLITVGRNLDRIATALEIIVRESYGITLTPPDADLTLEISYTDQDAIDEELAKRPSNQPMPAIGDEDQDEDR